MIPKEVTQQWRSWAEQAIGGSAERIEAALQAAIAAIESGKNRDEIVAAARDATRAWDSQDQQQQRAAPAGSTLKIPQGVFVGHVTNLDQRLELEVHLQYRQYIMVWSFRLERSAADGTRLPTVDVELSGGAWIGGSLFNGDLVAVDARKHKPGEVLQVEEVWNLTTNSPVIRFRQIGLLKTKFHSCPCSPIFAPLWPEKEKYGVIRGRIATLQVRQTGCGRDWTFRLQRTDIGGTRVPLVVVELCGLKPHGSLAVGDEVMLDAKGFEAGNILIMNWDKKPRGIQNLTSNSVFWVQ